MATLNALWYLFSKNVANDLIMVEPKTEFNSGIIEGFFGRGWPWTVRENYAEFLSANKYSFYIYAPKSDPNLRENWHANWSTDDFEKLMRLREIYRKTGVRWGIGLNLYEIHTNFDHSAKISLRNKVRLINDLQPDIMAVLFDDMRGDHDKLASIQTDICHIIRAISNAPSLIMCPTYYCQSTVLDRLFGQRPKDYLKTIGQRLDPSIQVFWTGQEICSTSYPPEHLNWVKEQIGRKPFIWDNYPVNDSAEMCNYLHLRAFEDRPTEMYQWIAGLAVNPMNQGYLSKIPLLTLRMSYEKKEEYSPSDALSCATEAICGKEFSEILLRDVSLFQDAGLRRLDEPQKVELIRKYSKFDNPFSMEIIDWLSYRYPASPDCLTE